MEDINNIKQIFMLIFYSIYDTDHLDVKILFFLSRIKGVTLFYASPYHERRKNRYGVTQFGIKGAARERMVRFVGPRC